ncbi:Egg cell-secreted protein 1.1 [Hibiscus syriacus]|uniref:Egg cell-secreted protein 1.1 n=1 Tax=Hibiscus syriacus TaxID=106335 RepID=A0A6A3BKK7_HIBSY|nr:egg cell-secreted protein 1.1-like [Hibiscus syriacus]KAE8715359.1 Egg cell-secreted protein 1.1 [Hibiscus syriacus]
MGSTCGVLFYVFVFVMRMLLMAEARPLDLPKTTRSDLLGGLKLDEESPDCWGSLIQLQSCTGELIMFFMNGETEIGHNCCHAIRTVSHQCWPNMIDALGFTTQETHVLEGYCDHEDDQSTPSVAVTNGVGVSKLPDP